jgi:ABC-type transporter Mla subunit MlaD
VENPFLIPPRLLARAADDLAVLTRSMTQIPDLLVRLDQRAGELDAMFEKLLPVGRSVDRTTRRAADGLERLLGRVDGMDARIGEAIERIDALDRRAGELHELADRVERLIEQVMAQAEAIGTTGEAIAAQAEALNSQAEAIGATLPTLARAVEMTQPLEGAVDRIGRIVDRLPGGRPQQPGT